MAGISKVRMDRRERESLMLVKITCLLSTADIKCDIKKAWQLRCDILLDLLYIYITINLPPLERCSFTSNEYISEPTNNVNVGRPGEIMCYVFDNGLLAEALRVMRREKPVSAERTDKI